MKPAPIRVLLIDGDRVAAERICQSLATCRDDRFEVRRAGDLADGLRQLAGAATDVTLLALNLPDSPGPEALQQAHRCAAETPIVVLCDGEPDEPDGRFLSMGAEDSIARSEAETGVLARVLRHAIERRRLQTELRAARQQAAAAERLQKAFLANMSHEIRTPMNALIGMIELVLRSELTDAQREHLGIALDSAESLLAIINDVLDYSNVETGRLSLAPAPFDLRSSLGELMRTLDVRATRKGLELRLEIDADTPGGLIGDVYRLRQVLMNLVGNAIKFTEQGRVDVRVGARPGVDEDVLLRFEISDTGVGVPRDMQSRIFEAFQQADASMTRRCGGPGLGLAISRELVLLMGGTIGVESDAGTGSEFHFTARMKLDPRADQWEQAAAPPRQAPAADAESEAAGQAPAARSLNILLAEDSPLNQRLMGELLGTQGHQVTVAANGREALERHAQAKFDLVLMDIQMPVMDGLAATREIRHGEQTGERIPIIALTAHALHEVREQCRDAGVDMFVAKPVRAKELFAAINYLLDGPPPPGPAPRSAPAVPRRREIVGRVDWQVALSTVDGSRRLLQEVVEIFLEEAPRLVSRIRQSVEGRDPGQLLLAAHTLQGSAGSIGALGVAQCAEQLELLANQQTVEDADLLIRDLETELSSITPALSNYRRNAVAADEP